MNGQYSLAALLVVVTAVCLGLGLGIPAYAAASKIEWSDPWLGWMLGGMGLVAAIGIALAILRR